MTETVQSSADKPISYRWVLERIVLPMSLPLFAGWLSYIQLQIADINVNIKSIEQRVTTNTVNSGVVVDRLDRIENKLDSLIDRQIVR